MGTNWVSRDAKPEHRPAAMTPGISGAKISPKVLSKCLILLSFWPPLMAALLAFQSSLAATPLSADTGMPMSLKMSEHLRDLPGPTTTST